VHTWLIDTACTLFIVIALRLAWIHGRYDWPQGRGK
jgi:hypothetical protein